ncbi:MAG: CHASE domain-containing protein [Burkholderiaceae bacterium]
MSRPSWASVLGLVFGILLTLLLWRYAAGLSARAVEDVFEQRVSHATLAVDRTLDELLGSMQTIRSLVETNGWLSEAAFERAMAARSQRLFHTGLQFLGLARQLERGASNCPPDPTLPACQMLARVYPLATNERLLQMDLAHGAARAAAVRRAIDYGYVALTEPLPWSEDNIASPGLIAFLPIYRRSESLSSVEGRRAALAGLAVASFSLEDIIRAELGGRFFRLLDLRIVDRGLIGAGAGAAAGPGSVVLDSRELFRREDDWQPRAQFDPLPRKLARGFAGRAWDYQFGRPALSWLDPSVTVPWMILTLGGLLSLLLAAFLQFLSIGRSRAEALAERMTSHLRASEAQLRLALEAAQMGSWQWFGDTGTFTGDERASRLLNLAPGPLEQVFGCLQARDRDKAVAALGADRREQARFNVEGQLARPVDGVSWVELSARLTRDPDGAVRGATGLVRDITERNRQAATQRRLLHQLVTAEEQQRRRIARELHDQLGQEITAISLGLRHFDRLEDQPQARRDLLARLRGIVTSIDDRVDKFMLDLRPVVLDDLGLEAALQTQFSLWSDLHEVKVNSHIKGLRGRELPFEVATTAFRVVQESLTNVARHAGATSVDVIVELVGGNLRVVVEDDGRGADGQVTARRRGLAGMRERVEALGGEFRHESTKGRGFSIFAKIPVAAMEQENT